MKKIAIALFSLLFVSRQSLAQCSVSGLQLISQSTDSVNIQWNSSPAASYYLYYLATTPVVDSTQLQSTSDTTLNLLYLCTNTKYYLFVSASCAAGTQSWDTLSFMKTCSVVQPPLNEFGLGVFCPGTTVNIGMPEVEVSQKYTWKQNGNPVNSQTANPNGGSGQNLSYAFIASPQTAGHYVIVTAPICGVCDSSVSITYNVYIDTIGGLQTTALTDTSVSFKWNPIVAGETYFYGITADSTLAPPDTLTTTSIAAKIMGLTPNTRYFILVSGNCDNAAGDVNSYGNWDTLAFTTPAVPYLCHVDSTSLSGSGVYCPNNTVSIGLPSVQLNQMYTWKQNGNPVYSAQPNAGSGGSLSYQFTMSSSAQAGHYTIVTIDTCHCCDSVAFGHFDVYLDSISGLKTLNPTESSISFQWNPVAPDEVYYYSMTTDSTQVPGNPLSTTNTSATITGLLPNTRYFIFVTGNCDNGVGDTGYGNWDRLAFTTASTACTPAPPPVITASGDTSICQGDSVTLNSSDATGNQWCRNESPINGATGQTFAATTAGSYTVILSGNGICSITSTPVVVSVNQTSLPLIGSSGSTTICYGDSVTLQSSSAAGNQWFKNNTAIPGADQQDYTTADSGVYTVHVSSPGLCGGISNPTTVTFTGPHPVISWVDGQLTSNSPTGNQWYRNDSIISGATGNTYTPTIPGSYSLQIASSSCGSNMSVPFVFTAADFSTPNVSVYPNPATEQISLVNQGINPVSVQFFDPTGREILSMTGLTGTSVLNIAKLSNGLYILRIEDEVTKHRVSKLILKEKHP